MPIIEKAEIRATAELPHRVMTELTHSDIDAAYVLISVLKPFAT
jgi:hypothetical protein